MSDFEKLINASDLIEWIMETYADWCEGAVRGIVDHVEELPSAQPEPQWIPCSETLPKENESVICATDKGTVTEVILTRSAYQNDAEPFYWEDPTGEYYYPFNSITAWMPLPEPYKGDE